MDAAPRDIDDEASGTLEHRVQLHRGVPFCVCVFIAARLLLSALGVLAVHDAPAVSGTGFPGAGLTHPVEAGWHNAFDGTYRWMRDLRTSYVVYAACTFGILFTFAYAQRPLLGGPRYAAVMFPAFWVLGLKLPSRAFVVAAAVSVVGYVIAAVVFMNQGFLF